MLGEMAELGTDAPRYTRRSAAAQNLGVDVVIGVGEPARAYVEGRTPGRDRDSVADARSRAGDERAHPPRRLRPRRGLARGRLGVESARWATRALVRVLVAGILALLISIAIGPRFHLASCARASYGRISVRTARPQDRQAGHADMGGVLIVVCDRSRSSRSRIITTNRCPLLRIAGLRRDRLLRRLHQVRRKPLARAARPLELLLLAAVAAVAGYVGSTTEFEDERLYPRDQRQPPLDLGSGTCSLLHHRRRSRTGENPTDGPDGLAAGTGIIAVFTSRHGRDRLGSGSSRVPACDRDCAISTSRSSARR